ncbi:hypothetical protein G6F62_015602 [Rhizopus arrhizus]|nr:hypothetical protein G6F62_015602 [Rhizopus arrhizus]
MTTRARPEAPASGRAGGGADAPSGAGSSSTSAPGAPITGIHQDLTVLAKPGRAPRWNGKWNATLTAAIPIRPRPPGLRA